MSKRILSCKVQYYLSLIPFLGFFIAWISSWWNIYRRTNDKKYIFLHFIIWILPMCIAGAVVAISIITFMTNLSPLAYKICGLLISYVACLIMAFSAILISKKIIKKFESRYIK